MFGEEKILGQIEATIDDKNRLILPIFTKREKDDNLVLIEDKDFNIFRIYTFEQISKIFEKINDNLLKATTEKEIKKYKKQTYNLSKSILKSSKVDKLGRVAVGETFSEIDKVNVIGAYDHVILELKK